MANSGRLLEYDLARSIALLGMLIINFWVMTEDDSWCPRWLHLMMSLIQGRAAPLFVVLAGAGLSLLYRGNPETRGTGSPVKVRSLILKRALFLFLLGWLNTAIWPADILHFYAFYFASGALVLTLSDRNLWSLLVGLMAAFALFMFAMNFDRGWQWDTIPFKDFWKLPSLLHHVLLNGIYPFFPWVAFFIFGLWLGRQDLSNPGRRIRMALWGALATAVLEFISWIIFRIPSSSAHGLDLDKFLPWFAIDPWEPMPIFVASAGGTALAVIALSAAVTERYVASRWLPPFLAVGQLSLTLYVAHILLGTLTLRVMKVMNAEPLFFPLWGALSFYACALALSWQWKRRFSKGPMEWLMRRFLVFSRPA